MTDKPPTECWGVVSAVEPISGGNRNRVFRTVGLANGLVFKTTRRKPAAIEWLAPVLDLAEQSGFIVPKPIKSRGGRYVEQGWTCEPFLHGRLFAEAEVTRIASRVQLLQNSAWHFRQRPGFLAASDFVEHDLGGDIDLRNMPADIVALCREAWSRIVSQPKSVVHGDLNPGNLIWTPDGGIGLVDWDEARLDATLFDGFHLGLSPSGRMEECAVLAWEVACSWNLEPAYATGIAEKLMRIAIVS